MSDSRIIVVALGGNAITKPGTPPDIDAQFIQTRESARALADLLDLGYQLVVTHGNGPQVGNALRRVELAESEVYTLPLEICVADTQGGMGYMIAQCLTNELRRRKKDQCVSCLVTTVQVDRDDPDFQSPSKPIGGYMDVQTATKYREQLGWTIREVRPGQFRRVVASPIPRHILERDAIQTLINTGHLIIACGGGGIPVIQDEQGQYQGIAAVVDKDRASALLATEIEAEMFIILTAVEKVCLNYDRPNQHNVDRLTLAEARHYLEEGQFPPGSMGPKIEAAIYFLEAATHSAAEVLITDLNYLTAALAGRTGTRIVRW
ncbi:MAG: Carbamate kinase 1 [Phycisphaerae bacterium]|nr:Carbamate kinase 1 [Phycisphaerae bacterium]